MTKCSSPYCHKLAHPLFEGKCIGCFFVLVYEPVKAQYEELRDRFTQVLANVPKAEFDKAKDEARVHASRKDREV